MFNSYNEVITAAREKLAGVCSICAECNGSACRGKVPGVGSKGSGASFAVCRDFLKSVKINMDAVHPHFEADTTVQLIGRNFAAPFFAAPIGGMELNYKGRLTETEYAEAVIKGSNSFGTFAFTGDGPMDEVFYAPLSVIKETGLTAVPTVKPWAQEKAIARIKEAEAAGSAAVAMDIDSASLINLKLAGKPVFTKSEEEIKELVQSTSLPFIVKGILTPKAAEHCARAGCYGIVVSNHGGRVMEDAPAPAGRLRDIKAAVGEDIKIFVDGGVRSGGDIFKCLALGADAVLLGRPYATAAFGGGAEGVKLLSEKLLGELKEIMLMTGAADIKSINSDMIIL